MISYLSWLRVAWGQSIGADLVPVAFWSAAAFCVAIPTVYIPTMALLRALLGGYKPLLWFPLAAVLLGIIPTILILFLWGGGVSASSLFTAEATLFYVMFITVGIIFGLGYAINRNEAT
jgi:hypothetical protein